MNIKLDYPRIVVVAAVFLASFFCIAYFPDRLMPVHLKIVMQVDGTGVVQVFWHNGAGFNAVQSSAQPLVPAMWQYVFSIPVWRLNSLRIDPCDCRSLVKFQHISADWLVPLQSWDWSNTFAGWGVGNQIASMDHQSGQLHIMPAGEDPYRA